MNNTPKLNATPDIPDILAQYHSKAFTFESKKLYAEPFVSAGRHDIMRVIILLFWRKVES